MNHKAPATARTEGPGPAVRAPTLRDLKPLWNRVHRVDVRGLATPFALSQVLETATRAHLVEVTLDDANLANDLARLADDGLVRIIEVDQVGSKDRLLMLISEPTAAQPRASVAAGKRS